MVDGRADLFAVGLLLHELISGRHPFYGLNQVQVMHRILSGSMPALEDCGDHPDPDRLRAVQHRALSRQPQDRYDDARTFRAALEDAARPLGGLASRKELAVYMTRLDPGSADTIARRLEAWRTHKVP